MIIRPLEGLGDAVYARPILVELAKREETWVETPWPQVFRGQIPCLPTRTGLRCQAENERASGGLFVERPPGVQKKRLSYIRDVRAGRGIMESLSGQCRVATWDFPFPACVGDAPRGFGPGKRACVFIPPTDRRQGPYPSRNPKVEYVNAALEALKDHGFEVWAVRHLAAGEEKLCTGIREELFDAKFLHGELSVDAIVGLMRETGRAVVTPGFGLPLGAASGASTFTIYGGYVGPWALEHVSMGDVSHAAPDPFCDCGDRGHVGCNKEIEGFADTFEGWL